MIIFSGCFDNIRNKPIRKTNDAIMRLRLVCSEIVSYIVHADPWSQVSSTMFFSPELKRRIIAIIKIEIPMMR